VSHTPSSHADSRAALADSLERLCRYHQALGNLFLTVAEGTRYQLTENDNWLTGFWTGLLCWRTLRRATTTCAITPRRFCPVSEGGSTNGFTLPTPWEFTSSSVPEPSGKSLRKPGSWPCGRRWITPRRACTPHPSLAASRPSPRPRGSCAARPITRTKGWGGGLFHLW